MTDDDDKNKNTPPEDHHDEFEEEFAFDSDVTDTDDFLQEDHEEAEPEAGIPNEPKPKGSILPLLIGLVIVGFIGWKGYRYFFPKVTPIENAQITPVPDSSVPVTPENEPIKLPTQEMPSELSAQGTSNQNLLQQSATPPTQPPEPTPAPTQPTTPAPGTNGNKPTGNVLPSTTSSIPLPTPKNEKPSTIPSLDQTSKAPPLSQAPKAPSTTEQSSKSEGAQDTEIPRTQHRVQIPPSSSEGLNRLEEKIEEQERVFKQQIQGLEKDLAQSAADTHKGIDSLQDAVRNLSEQIKNLKERPSPKKQPEAAERKQPKPRPKPERESERPKKKHHVERKEANPSLSVYAIIPGRAWLKTSSGKTITVSEGDTIAEYGRVLKIDAGNAIVVTSSGVVLH